MGGIVSNVIKSNHNIPSKSDFSFGQIVGIGGFGIVREICRLSDDNWFIMKEFNLLKIIRTKNSIPTVILNELSSLRMISPHPFIIKLYAAFRDHHTVYFVMDMLSGGDLRLNIRLGEKFTEYQTSYIIGCIGSALQHIHRHGIIHRDVKPENIMFNFSGIPKLIDFGISHLFSSNIGICQRQSGTKEYLAPEILTTTHYHGFESDFWSLGIVMHEMLFHKRPHQEIISSNMLLYSSMNFESIWEMMFEQHQNSMTRSDEKTETSSKYNPSEISDVVTATTNIISNIYNTQSNKSTTKNSIFSPRSYYLDFGHFYYLNPTLESSSSSCFTDSDLVYSIPDVNINQESITELCKEMLLSLLDVRIHKRIGVGDRYDLFKNHKWFLSNGWSNLETFTIFSTPFSPNTSKIEYYLTSQYGQLTIDKDFQDKQENHRSSIYTPVSPVSASNPNPSNPSNPSFKLGVNDDVINNLLGNISYVSPEYYN